MGILAERQADLKAAEDRYRTVCRERDELRSRVDVLEMVLRDARAAFRAVNIAPLVQLIDATLDNTEKETG